MRAAKLFFGFAVIAKKAFTFRRTAKAGIYGDEVVMPEMEDTDPGLKSRFKSIDDRVRSANNAVVNLNPFTQYSAHPHNLHS